MSDFASLKLPAERTLLAPDGSDVRVLLSLACGSMAHFALAAGRSSATVMHRTVEEVWYVLAGRGKHRAGHQKAGDVAGHEEQVDRRAAEDQRIDDERAGGIFRRPVRRESNIPLADCRECALLIVVKTNPYVHPRQGSP